MRQRIDRALNALRIRLRLLRRWRAAVSLAVAVLRTCLSRCRDQASVLVAAASRIRHRSPWRWNLAFLLAAVAMLSGFGYTGYPSSSAVVSMPIPKPALPSQSWQERVDSFGLRVHKGLGVPHAKATEFAHWILEAAERQQLAPELVASLVFTESSFRKVAYSAAGAVGPTQIKPHYWAEFCGVDNLHDPEQNIYCGAQILAHLKDRCGGQACALAAYNIGVNSTRKQAGLRYVSKIDRHRAKIEAI